MMRLQAQENNSQHSDFTVDNHTGIRYHKDMENTQTAYTEADKEAVRILRAAYMESTASGTLYNARQYLQDRARYLRLQALKVESRAAYLQSLGWPSAPWTDGDHKRFTDASDRWDGAYSKEYRAEGGAA